MAADLRKAVGVGTSAAKTKSKPKKGGEEAEEPPSTDHESTFEDTTEEVEVEEPDLHQRVKALEAMVAKQGKAITKLQTESDKMKARLLAVEKEAEKDRAEWRALVERWEAASTPGAAQDTLDKLQAEEEKLRAQRIAREVEDRAAALIVRGVSGEKDEIPTKMADLVADMGLAGAVEIKTTIVLAKQDAQAGSLQEQPRKQGEKAPRRPPPVKVVFGDKWQARKVLAALPKWGGVEANRGVRFAPDYPPSLRGRLRALEDIAYTLRHDKRWKTSIREKNGRLHLFVKEAPNRDFHLYEE